MNEQEHRDFLLETAEKVSTWIIDEVRMKRFKEQVKAFYDDFCETPDRIDRLVLPYATHLDAHIGKITDDDYLKHISIPFDEEKSLQDDYVLLTIIHDKRLKNPRTPPIRYESVFTGYLATTEQRPAPFPEANLWRCDDFQCTVRHRAPKSFP